MENVNPMSGPALTRVQRAVLEQLRQWHHEQAQPPTLDELCRTMGLKSRGSLHKHVGELIRAGLVEPMDRRHRGVRLRAGAGLGEAEGALPLLGTIAAGRPIEALEVPETLEVPEALRGRGDCFVLRVKGDSMIDAGILDGDWVIVESRISARNGELVVALIDGEEVTLKRIDQAPGRCTLLPANPACEPMEFSPERVRIQGVVVAQMRRY